MKKERPSFEDYLAAGALANVPFWMYVLLLTLDLNKYSFSAVGVFYTIAPLATMIAGGFVATFLVCTRVGKATVRIALTVGLAATVVNFVFGLITSESSVTGFAALCFIASGILAVVLKRTAKNLEKKSICPSCLIMP